VPTLKVKSWHSPGETKEYYYLNRYGLVTLLGFEPGAS
jgi:hypothetical protein